jgi:glycerol-3-phosphate acyltransferase PlsY
VTRELLVVAGYVLGSIPFALLAVRLAGKGDIRKVGSGNVGATNTLRAAGWKVALPVALLDIGKGVAAVLLMRSVTANPAWLAAAGLAAIVGHCFPVWLGFSGGKGVATAAGVFGALAPTALLVAAGIWVAGLLVTRIVSVSSLLAAAGFPVVLYFLRHPRPEVMACAVAAAMVIIFRHRKNVRRLARGEEPRLFGRKR